MPALSDRAVLAAVAFLVIVADQLTKAVAIAWVGPGTSDARIDVVGSWVAIEYAENRGVAFGMFARLGPVLLVVSGVVLAGLLVYYLRESSPPRWQSLSIGLIAGGAIGNVVDRFRLGHVIDFVAVGPWPNFNLADSAIFVGAVMMIVGWFSAERDASAARAG